MEIKKFFGMLILPAVICVVFISCTHDSELTSYNDPNPANQNAPLLDSITPAQGAPGDTITITGTGFNSNPVYNLVSFGTDVGKIISATSTELKVVLPNFQDITIPVKVAIKGSVYWSNALDFVFIKVIETVAEGILDLSGIAVDDDNNIYVGSIGDRTIYKISPEGEQTVFVSEIDVDGAIHFGPEGYLYVCEQNNNVIVRVSPDGSSVEEFAALPGNPIDFDWDMNGNMFVVMNWDGIYKLDGDGNFTSEASVSDALTCRVFENNLYVCNSWSGQVIKFNITAGGTLEEVTRYDAGETTMGIEVDQNGTVYYDKYWTTSLFTIDAEGNQGFLFENQLIYPMRYFCYHGKTLYVAQNEGVDSGGGTEGVVMKIYTGINQAPNYGRN